MDSHDGGDKSVQTDKTNHENEKHPDDQKETSS